MKSEHLFQAIWLASFDIIWEGNVESGTRIMTHGFKGGVRTSSNKHDEYTIGVLVQSNYGIWKRLIIVRNSISEIISNELLAICGRELKENEEVGGIIVIVTTNASLLSQQLKRLALCVPIGIAFCW